MSNNIYYILAGLVVIYLLIGISNKKTARRRKSRQFMEGYQRKDRPARPDRDKEPEPGEKKEK